MQCFVAEASLVAGQTLGVRASVLVVHMGLVAPWLVESSPARVQTCVPCIGRRILIHCTTREAPPKNFFKINILAFSMIASGFSILIKVSINPKFYM